MFPVLVNVPAIKVPVFACVTPPAEVVRSTVPPLPTLTLPANVSAWLSTTASVPPDVSPAIVPIWFAVPSRDAAPKMFPVLVRVPAINVPVFACVTPPAEVVRSTVPPLPTLTVPANVSA